MTKPNALDRPGEAGGQPASRPSSEPRFAELYRRSRQALAEGSAANPIQVRAESRNMDGFESRVRIRDFELVIDQPKGFEGSNRGPKPSEVLLASLAACQEITWRLYADALGVPLDGVRVELTGVQDLRGFLGVDDETPAGFQEISGTVYIDSPADDSEVARLRREVDAHCPVLDDLRRPLKVTLDCRRDEGEQSA
jgi:uncharacterized OsmC-like protein